MLTTDSDGYRMVKVKFRSVRLPQIVINLLQDMDKKEQLV